MGADGMLFSHDATLNNIAHASKRQSNFSIIHAQNEKYCRTGQKTSDGAITENACGRLVLF